MSSARLDRPVPYTIGPRRDGDPAVLFASSQKARSELGWSPRFPELATIVDTACRWHLVHPRGYLTECKTDGQRA